MTDAVIQADFSDFRQVKSRKVAQLIFEIPLEALPQAMERLGWPKPGEGLPVAIARLQAVPEAPKAAQRRLSQEAHLWCNRTDFQQWLGKKDLDGAKQVVKGQCVISSLSELDTNPDAAETFRSIVHGFEKNWHKKPQTPQLDSLTPMRDRVGLSG